MAVIFQGLTLKAKAKAWTLKTKAKDWTFKAKAKAWTFKAKPKAKDKKFGLEDPRGQGLASRTTSLADMLSSKNVRGGKICPPVRSRDQN